jgi:RAD51-like protein 1
MRYLPTGLEPLDQALRGGVRVGTITELVGPAGVGKTQLAMQLCIMASRYAQGCVYVDTEKKLSVARLREIALQRSSRVPDTNTHGEFLYPSDTTLVESTVDISATSRNCFRSPQEVLDNVTVHSPSNIDELFGALSEVEDELFSRNHQSVGSSNAKFPVRLLVLDSIAAPARRDFGAGSAPELASTVIKIAQTLKRLADQHHLVVVVINQVGSSILGTDAVIDQTGIRPALGTSWHHCVSTRVLFEFEADLVSSSSLSNSDGPLRGRAPSRQLSVIKSNLTGPGKPIVFDLTLFGIVIKA